MRTFLYGVLVGAIAAWLAASQGATFDSLLSGAFGWRDSAKGSIGGYGGTGQRR